MKYFFICFFVVFHVKCLEIPRDTLLDEFIEAYEDVNEKATWADPRFCTGAGLECYECSECHDHLQYGQCIKGASTARCLCNWGWTGQNAVRVPNNLEGTSRFGINRIRADDCKSPCFYGPYYWNSACAEQPTPVTTTMLQARRRSARRRIALKR